MSSNRTEMRASRRGLLGSTAAQAALALAAPAILTRGRPAVAQTMVVRIGGTGAALGGLRRLGEALTERSGGPAVRVVPDLGTLGGLRAVAAGAIDLALSARPPTEAEGSASLQCHHYASSPLVFVTHPATPFDVITHDQAVALIAGTQTAWPDGSPVRLVRRPTQDGDTALLARLSPAMAEAVQALQRRPGIPTNGTDHAQAAAIEATPGSFGAITLSLVRSESRPLKVLSLEGRDPLAAGWPMMKRLHAIATATPAPAATAMLAYLQSELAAELLTRLGHSMVQGS
jgi:phosphate transport system substrate-binding protein